MRNRTWKIMLLFALGIPLSLAVLPVSAGREVLLKALLVTDCLNCPTDVGSLSTSLNPNRVNKYSLLPDAFFPYFNGSLLGAYNPLSGIYDPTNSSVRSSLINSGVYTFNTEDTVLSPPLRPVVLHFYDSSGRSLLPPCWQGNPDQMQVVNWNVHSDVTIAQIPVGSSSNGFSRLNFNVRNGVCDNQIYRFYLKWYDVCISHPDQNTWIATSDECGWLSEGGSNYGTAGLSGQGGKKRETTYYGDFRVPFQLILTKP